MKQKFETHGEAAIWMIQNPGKELVSSAGYRYLWDGEGLRLFALSVGEWRNSTQMDPGPYTLPEPEKEELPELSKSLADVLEVWMRQEFDEGGWTLTRSVVKAILAEAEARARAVADERIEAATIIWRDSGLSSAACKLKRGAK